MDKNLAHLINGQWRKGRNTEEITVVDPATEETLAGHMRRAGFSTVTWERLTFGIAAIHVGTA